MPNRRSENSLYVKYTNTPHGDWFKAFIHKHPGGLTNLKTPLLRCSGTLKWMNPDMTPQALCIVSGES